MTEAISCSNDSNLNNLYVYVNYLVLHVPLLRIHRVRRRLREEPAPHRPGHRGAGRLAALPVPGSLVLARTGIPRKEVLFRFPLLLVQ